MDAIRARLVELGTAAKAAAKAGGKDKDGDKGGKDSGKDKDSGTGGKGDGGGEAKGEGKDEGKDEGDGDGGGGGGGGVDARGLSYWLPLPNDMEEFRPLRDILRGGLRYPTGDDDGKGNMTTATDVGAHKLKEVIAAGLQVRIYK